MSEIRVDTFKAEDGISAPSFPNGIQIAGITTATGRIGVGTVTTSERDALASKKKDK